MVEVLLRNEAARRWRDGYGGEISESTVRRLQNLSKDPGIHHGIVGPDRRHSRVSPRWLGLPYSSFAQAGFATLSLMPARQDSPLSVLEALLALSVVES